jgi:hypothetical protein
MIKNRYCSAGLTPSAGSLAIMVGRMYSEVPADLGIQSRSSKTNSFMPWKKRSGAIWGMTILSVEAFIRSMFLSGRNRAIPPSGR